MKFKLPNVSPKVKSTLTFKSFLEAAEITHNF